MRWPYIVYPILSSRHGVHPQAHWTIVSYDLAGTETIGAALAQGTYDLVVLDEAHYLKTIDTRRTRASFGDHTGYCREPIRDDEDKITGYRNLFPALAGRCGAVMALTGTPLPNRPREAYTLARNLCLAEGTLVLTDRGPIPIQSVTADDRVWDGIEWVNHAGLSDQGEQRTLNEAGVWATGQHKIFNGLQTSQTFLKFASHEETHSQMSAFGLVSLLCWGFQSVKAEQPSLFAAIAELDRTALLRTISKECEAAVLVRLHTPLQEVLPDEDTRLWCLNLLCAIVCSPELVTPSIVATIQKTPPTNTMELEELSFTMRGEKIAANFLSIYPSWKALTTRICNWIELTTTVATSPVISTSSPEAVTCKIEEMLPRCLNAYWPWRQCYDLVNAGPRRRFTILTDEGALVVSNCFDSIDWMSEAAFKTRFNPSAVLTGRRNDGTEYTYVREEVGRASELQSRLRANFMVRHLKKDVMTQLKLPIYDLVRVIETKSVKDALAAENLLQIDLDTLDEAGIKVDGQWAEVRHRLGLAIAPQVVEYAEMCLDGGEDKLLIGAWHIDVLDFLQHKLAKYGVVRIDGSTSTNQRKHRMETFITNPRVRIMLGNMMALGVGVDGLQQVCSHCLLAEPDPVPGNNEQFIDRLDRGGQERTVQADLFVAPGSLLEKILASSLRKRHNTHKALDRRT